MKCVNGVDKIWQQYAVVHFALYIFHKRLSWNIVSCLVFCLLTVFFSSWDIKTKLKPTCMFKMCFSGFYVNNIYKTYITNAMLRLVANRVHSRPQSSINFFYQSMICFIKSFYLQQCALNVTFKQSTDKFSIAVPQSSSNASSVHLAFSKLIISIFI